jgi:hypothetical protein
MARIALDIDSTLHHYWDLLDGISRRRYGVELPYDQQHAWGITELESRTRAPSRPCATGTPAVTGST